MGSSNLLMQRVMDLSAEAGRLSADNGRLVMAQSELLRTQGDLLSAQTEHLGTQTERLVDLREEIRAHTRALFLMMDRLGPGKAGA
jgi:hypothetical protein